MTIHFLPATPTPSPITFDPVPRRGRHDGWTVERQRGFIAALAETCSVRHAARSVGLSDTNAYRLRRSPGAESFAAAWDTALEMGARRLADVAMERVIDGVATPVFHKGEQVGERRHYSERMTMFFLRKRLPEEYGDEKEVSAATREKLYAQWHEEQSKRGRSAEELVALIRSRLEEIEGQVEREEEEKRAEAERRMRESWGPGKRGAEGE